MTLYRDATPDEMDTPQALYSKIVVPVEPPDDFHFEGAKLCWIHPDDLEWLKHQTVLVREVTE